MKISITPFLSYQKLKRFIVIISCLIDCSEVTMGRSLFAQMPDFTLNFCLDRNHCEETEKENIY